MKGIRCTLLCGILSMSWLSVTSTNLLYTLDISYGDFPKGVTAEDVDGLALDEKCYKHGLTDNGWTVDRYGNKGYVVVSPTRSEKGGVQNNRLLLPEITVTGENVVVRWGACSAHPDFPESYDVIVVTPEGKEEVIFSTEGESYDWTVHTVGLDAYDGKEINVGFVATSASGYLLVIDDVEVGEMTAPAFQVTDLTRRYAGLSDEKVSVNGVISNVGMTLDLVKLVCKVDDEVADEMPVNGAFATGSKIDYMFEIPSELNKSTHYYIYGIDSSGSEIAIHDDSFFTSYFRRTLLVDKGTGMWCNNCPSGILVLESLKSRYGNSLIAVETHVDDALGQRDMWDKLGFYAAPYFKLNRNNSTANSNDSKFKKEYEAETSWHVRFAGLEKDGERLNVKVNVMSALGVDNSTDRYRVGWMLTRDYDEQPEGMMFYQSNNMTGPTGKRFYYLPSYVSADMVKFHDVTLPSEYAFTGIAGSIPDAVEPYSEYSASWSIPVADCPDDMKGINVIVYVLDCKTGYIENAATMTLDRWVEVASTDDIIVDNDMDIYISSDGICTVTFGAGCDGDYRLDLFNASGSKLYSVSDVISDSRHERHRLSLSPGIVIARLNSGNKSLARKFVIK